MSEMGNISGFWPNSEEKEYKDDYTCWGPTNMSLGGWSHDQILKRDQSESCSPEV